MDDFDGIAALPEQVAQVVVGADFFAHSLTQPEERPRVVDHEAGMHLERQLPDAVLARERGGFFPVGDYLLFPLPLDDLFKVVRPAISDPIGVLGALGVARAAGETHNHRHLQSLRQQHRPMEGLPVALGDSRIRVQGVPVATECANADVPVIKLSLPGPGLGWIVEHLLDRAVRRRRIIRRGDLHRLEPERRELVEEGIEREMIENRVEDADGYFARYSRRSRNHKRRKRDRRVRIRSQTGLNAGGSAGLNGRGRERATRCGKKLPAA